MPQPKSNRPGPLFAVIVPLVATVASGLLVGKMTLFISIVFSVLVGVILMTVCQRFSALFLGAGTTLVASLLIVPYLAR